MLSEARHEAGFDAGTMFQDGFMGVGLAVPSKVRCAAKLADEAAQASWAASIMWSVTP